jgi:hypothetical protein
MPRALGHTMPDAVAAAFGPSATARSSRTPCSWAAGPWARRPTGSRSTAGKTPRSALPEGSLREVAHLAAPAQAAAPQAPIPRPSDRSDSALPCERELDDAPASTSSTFLRNKRCRTMNHNRLHRLNYFPNGLLALYIWLDQACHLQACWRARGPQVRRKAI